MGELGTIVEGKFERERERWYKIILETRRDETGFLRMLGAPLRTVAMNLK